MRFALSYLREDSKVVVGDTVETWGRGGVCPKGILIGTVESVQPEESGLWCFAVIKPFVSVDNVSLGFHHHRIHGRGGVRRCREKACFYSRS